MNICVLGTGYVGLVTGAVFADMGNEVVCVDSIPEKIAMLDAGKMPIYEPGLEEMVRRNVADSRLRFSTKAQDSIRNSEIVFICVGTPPMDNGETDLSQVRSAAEIIGKNLNGYKVIVNKSTVPVGTGDIVRTVIESVKGNNGHGFDVVSNPEFLREGSAIHDALDPDRIVIGAPTKQVAMKLLELYAMIGKPIIVTDVSSAEIIKYASNSFLAMKISFINAVANICELAGANVDDVARGIGADKRIGRDFLSAGLGYGGSCFPKDVISLVHTSQKLGYEFDLLREVIRINDDRVNHFHSIIAKRFPDMKGKTFAVLGLAFKPDTDDIREAKSFELIKLLIAGGASVRAFDPVAMDNAKKIMPGITYCQNAYSAAEKADAVIIVTEWREFKQLNLERLRDAMKTPVLFDGRNMYNPDRKRKIGFEYYGIGRG